MAMDSVLVVDDDHELRETICEVLRGEGLQVTAAAGVDQALKLLEKQPVHLILLDMVMPGADGISAIVLFRRLTPCAKIIIMTAYASVQNAVYAMQRGADDYLVKPVKIKTLLATIRRNLAEGHFCDCLDTADDDQLFQGFANHMRRRIVSILNERGVVRFMELVRILEIEDHTKVNFHLKILRKAGLISQDENKSYTLTASGTKAAACLGIIRREMSGA